MRTWVALLRGINVGGHRRVPMPVLRRALAEAGFEDVRTYVNSGNVVTDEAASRPHLGVEATSRNWRTLAALVDLVGPD